MSTLDPTVPDVRTRTASNTVTLRASAVLTSAYVVSTNDVNVQGWEVARLGLDYNDGDETTADIYVEGYDGTGWRILTRIDTSGVVTKDVITLAPANYTDAGDSIVLPRFDVTGLQKIRTQQKATGGTPTGTLAVTCTLGIGIVARGV